MAARSQSFVLGRQLERRVAAAQRQAQDIFADMLAGLQEGVMGFGITPSWLPFGRPMLKIQFIQRSSNAPLCRIPK